MMLCLLLLTSLNSCGGAGDIFSPSSTSNSQSNSSAVQTAGDKDCSFSCEPVDIANCNDTGAVGEPQAVCYLISQHCKGPAATEGPDFGFSLPKGCAVIQPVTSEDTGEEEGSSSISSSFRKK